MNARESQQIHGNTGGADLTTELFLAQPPLGSCTNEILAWQGEDEVEAQMLALIERESLDCYEQQQQQANSQKLMEECGALMYNRTQMAWLMRHEACDLDRLMFAWIIHRVGFMQGKNPLVLIPPLQQPNWITIRSASRDSGDDFGVPPQPRA